MDEPRSKVEEKVEERQTRSAKKAEKVLGIGSTKKLHHSPFRTASPYSTIKMMFKSLAVLGLVAATSATPTPGEVKVPVADAHRNLAREDGTIKEKEFFNMINRVIGKYRSDAHIDIDWAKYGLEKRAGRKEPLIDFVQGSTDELYYGPGTVGGQKFTFDFDTGSSDTFIPGPGCSGCSKGARYDQKGTNLHKKTSVTYGSGQVSGNDYADTVCVAGFCAKKQTIISLKNAAGFSGEPSNSLMGMAFKSIAASGASPWFSTLVSQGGVSKPEFSFFLGRSKSKTQGLSEMFIGGKNPALYTGAFHNVPLSNESYWQVGVGQTTIGGKPVTGSKGNAAMDTGTTIVLMPTVVAQGVCDGITGCAPVPGLSGSPDLTLYEIPCGTKLTPSFQLGGKSFAVNPLDITIGSLTGLFREIVDDHAVVKEKRQLPIIGGLCVAAFGGFDIDPTINLYVIGDTFLKNYYSTFYMGAKPYYSLAKAKHNYGA